MSHPDKQPGANDRLYHFRDGLKIKHPFPLQPLPGWPGGELVLTQSFSPEGLDMIQAQFGDRFNLDNFLLVDAWAARTPGTDRIRAELFRTAAKAYDGDNALTGERLGIQATNFAKDPAFALIKHACSGGQFFPKGRNAHEMLDKLHGRTAPWVRGASQAAFRNILPATGTIVASEMLPPNLQPYAQGGVGMLALGSIFLNRARARDQINIIQHFVDTRRDKGAFAVALTELNTASRLAQFKESTDFKSGRLGGTVVKRMAETAVIDEDGNTMWGFIQENTQNGQALPVGSIRDFPRPRNIFALSAQLAAGAAMLGDIIRNDITVNLPSLSELTSALFDVPPGIAQDLLESIKAHPRRPEQVLMHISPTLAALMSAQAFRGDHKTIDDLIIDGTIGKALGVRGPELLAAKGYVVHAAATSQDSHTAQGRTRLLKAYGEQGNSVFFGSKKNALRVLLPPDIKIFLIAQLFLNHAPIITRDGGKVAQSTKGTDHIQKAVKGASALFKDETRIPAAFALPVLADLQTTKQYLKHVVDHVHFTAQEHTNKCSSAIRAIQAMQQNIITYALSEIIGTPEEYKQLLTNPDRIKMMSFLVRELYQVDDPDLRAHLDEKIRELIGSRQNSRGDTVSGLLRPSGIFYDGIRYTDAIVDAFNHTLETNGSHTSDAYADALRDAVAISYGEAVHFLSIGSDNHKGQGLVEYLQWAKNYVRPYIIPHLTPEQQVLFLDQLTTAIRSATSGLADMGPHSHEDKSSTDNRYKAQGLIDIAIGMCSMTDNSPPHLSDQLSSLTSAYEGLKERLNTTLYRPRSTVTLE